MHRLLYHEIYKLTLEEIINEKRVKPKDIPWG